mmetsp:Transcript_130282/g.362962  ORF Transcript_130282/g.362962 Transcript_130282/m.362962 type:complete len:387 (-) Transcript_130282:749-1909(-)
MSAQTSCGRSLTLQDGTRQAQRGNHHTQHSQHWADSRGHCHPGRRRINDGKLDEPARRSITLERGDHHQEPLRARRRLDEVKSGLVGGAPAAGLLLAGLRDDGDGLAQRLAAAVGEVDAVLPHLLLVDHHIDHCRPEPHGPGDLALVVEAAVEAGNLARHGHIAAREVGLCLAVRPRPADLLGLAREAAIAPPALLGLVVPGRHGVGVLAVAIRRGPLELLRRVEVANGARGGHRLARVRRIARHHARQTSTHRRTVRNVEHADVLLLRQREWHARLLHGAPGEHGLCGALRLLPNAIFLHLTCEARGALPASDRLGVPQRPRPRVRARVRPAGRPLFHDQAVRVRVPRQATCDGAVACKRRLAGDLAGAAGLHAAAVVRVVAAVR